MEEKGVLTVQHDGEGEGEGGRAAPNSKPREVSD